MFLLPGTVPVGGGGVRAGGSIALVVWEVSGVVGVLVVGGAGSRVRRFRALGQQSFSLLSWVLVSEELTLVAAAPVPCMLVCNRPSTEKLSSAQLMAIKPALEFKMPMTINPNRQTAVSIINPSSSDTLTVKISILDSSGQGTQL